MKSRGDIILKPRSRRKNTNDIDLGRIVNVIYNDFVVSLRDQTDQYLWSVMTRSEKRNFVRNMKKLIACDSIKPLRVPLEGDFKIIYVPGDYQGTAADYFRQYNFEKHKKRHLTV